MTSLRRYTTRFNLFAATLVLLGSAAHAADVAVMIDRGAGTAPTSSDTPVIIDQRPIVVVDAAAQLPATQTLIVAPANGAQHVQITTTPNSVSSSNSSSTVVVDQSAPTRVERHMTATPSGMITSTTVSQPVTTTTVNADGVTQQTNTTRTTTVVHKPVVKQRYRSSSLRVYNSQYRYNPRYYWNGSRWVHR